MEIYLFASSANYSQIPDVRQTIATEEGTDIPKILHKGGNIFQRSKR